jgi:hypothetical protein
VKVVDPVSVEDNFEELIVTVPVLSVVAVALPDTNPLAVMATLALDAALPVWSTTLIVQDTYPVVELDLSQEIAMEETLTVLVEVTGTAETTMVTVPTDCAPELSVTVNEAL